ncbi:MAG: T9SS C-terminal target domain-containing protein [Balneolaceae bacterium]|nr:MAG: T9SS C-terminal target domain-containing protein [Balneolaceae bacterium]
MTNEPNCNIHHHLRKIFLLSIGLFFFQPCQARQILSNPQLPRTAVEFKDMLDRGFYRYTVPFNSGSYDLVFSQDEPIFLPIGLRIMFEEPDGVAVENNQTTINFENITFTGNNEYSMEFMLHHPVIFSVKNVRFINTGRLWFRHGFESNMYMEDQQSSITLDGNYIENLNYRQEPYYSAVLFMRHRGMDDPEPIPVALNNITLINNHVNIKRDAEASNYVDDDFYIKRTFTSGVHFNRTTNRDYINNVRFENNIIEANNAPGYDTPVWAFNLENRGFTGTDYTNYLYDHLFEKNTNFYFNNNTIKTQSKYQSGAVFFMGPFTGLEFKNNVVEGFKRYQIHNCPEADESLCENYRWGTEARPVVVFYGARITENSNSIRNIVAESNTIRTGSSGFRINGTVNGIFRNNTIYMEEEIELPPFYNNRNYVPISDRSALIVSSGHAWDAKYKARNILIENNTIYGNNHDNVAAIRLFHGTDLTVTNNRIYDISSYGIHHESSVTWADEHYVGTIEISDNIITTSRLFSEMSTARTLYFSYLDSYEHLQLNNFTPPAMISFSRLVTEDKIHQIQNENIIITNNTIKKRDVDTLPVFFENGVILKNGQHRPFSTFDSSIFNRNNYIVGPNYYNEFVSDGVWSEAGLPDGKWVTGDFNGDGFTDILRSTSPDRGAEVWFGGGESFTPYYAGIWTSEPNFGKWYTGRFTQAGKDELMSFERQSNGSGVMRIYTPVLSDRTNSWKLSLTQEMNMQAPAQMEWVIGDVNGNGYSDLIRALSEKGGAEVFLNDGNGNFINSGVWLDDAVNNQGKWYTGDFNGDGADDLLSKINEHGGAYIFYSDPDNERFEQPIIMNQAGIAGDWIIGDFSGDGFSDVLRPRFTDSKGNAHDMRIWFGYNLVHPANSSGFHDGEIWSIEDVKSDWYTGNFINNGRSDLMTTRNQNSGGALVFVNNMVRPEPAMYNDENLPAGVSTTGHITEPITEVELFQNYPNPFNPVTNIIYRLPREGNVRLTVYAITGQRLLSLVDEYQYPGTYTITADAGTLASGVYIYRLQLGNEVRTRKFTVIK